MRGMGDPSRLEGMSVCGVAVERALGIGIPALRALAKEVGRDHTLAAELWDSGWHEARILASMVDEPDKVTCEQMDLWVSGFDSWDLCDQCCNNLFRLTPHAWGRCREWCVRDDEFVRRAGFVLMACLAVHDRKAGDEEFMELLSLIQMYSSDGRNFVRKAVSWALRQIGKRDPFLNSEAVRTAERIAGKGDRSSAWVATDALRELRSVKVRQRLMTGRGNSRA